MGPSGDNGGAVAIPPPYPLFAPEGVVAGGALLASDEDLSAAIDAGDAAELLFDSLIL